MQRLPNGEHVDLAVEVFRMLADATRVQLLWLLVDAESSVNKLATAIGKPPAAVSQHLAKLRLARLVQTRRQGTHVFYSISNDHVAKLVVDAIHNTEQRRTRRPRTPSGRRLPAEQDATNT